MPATEFGSFMTIGELRQAIKDLPDEMVVVIQEHLSTAILTRSVEVFVYDAFPINDYNFTLHGAAAPPRVSSQKVALIH